MYSYQIYPEVDPDAETVPYVDDLDDDLDDYLDDFTSPLSETESYDSDNNTDDITLPSSGNESADDKMIKKPDL
jgi:hypothetical protein